jgi:predicted MFS family arabinose efflux permease
LGATVVNRWFTERRGLAMGILTASNATGQLIFLPLLAGLVEAYGWQVVSLVVAGFGLTMIPVIALFMSNHPFDVASNRYGEPGEALPPVRSLQNPAMMALRTLGSAARSLDFWLLFFSFYICGLSTNGLIGTHFIPLCFDHGIPEVTSASLLAVIGAFDFVGTLASGWLSDRVNNRVLLFWYYGLRGLSLAVLPFTSFDVVSLSIFSIFYGLDWVATGPATFALSNQLFGRRDAPIIISWIFAAHQIGGAIAAFGAGAVRSFSGDYLLAFMTSGLACLLAALLVLRVNRPAAEIVHAV